MRSDIRGSAAHLDPIATWADDTIDDMIRTYCHDGAGNPKECSPSELGSAYHGPVLESNDPVSIKGGFEARRIIVASPEDPVFRHTIIYRAYAGKMRGYHFTVPCHFVVRVTGPVWDYGMGGLR